MEEPIVASSIWPLNIPWERKYTSMLQIQKVFYSVLVIFEPG